MVPLEIRKVYGRIKRSKLEGKYRNETVSVTQKYTRPF